MTDTITIRLATLDDVPALMNHRYLMFKEMDSGDESGRTAMNAAFEGWVSQRLARGEYRSWLAVNGAGEVIAGADLWVMDWPPGPFDASCKQPFVYNVYTQPAYRKQGIARRLMTELVDYCRSQGYTTVGLHASDFGRALYESMGFEQTNEMRLILK
jgi:GNAT superfamily N-acetyltransferase